MDRDSFPTLTENATGWPMMTVPWSGGRSISVAVFESEDYPIPVVQVISEMGFEFDPGTACEVNDSGHAWRRVAGSLISSELRNRPGVVESWHQWRLVDVCNGCGYPRVVEEWTRDE